MLFGELVERHLVRSAGIVDSEIARYIAGLLPVLLTPLESLAKSDSRASPIC